MIVVAKEFIPLLTVHCFNNGYVGKQPVAWKEYCTQYWLKELQESMGRYTGQPDITEIMFKNGVEQYSVNQSNITVLLFLVVNEDK